MKQLREQAEKFTFQAEVNRMMKIIINSLYRNKEVGGWGSATGAWWGGSVTRTRRWDDSVNGTRRWTGVVVLQEHMVVMLMEQGGGWGW